MSRFGVRHRAVVALAGALLIGLFGVEIFRVLHQWNSCSSPVVRAGHLCGFNEGYRPAVRWAVRFALPAAALAVCWLLARWVLQPVASLTATVRNLGPNNLTQRTGARGGGSDEVDLLARSLDELMDRIAAGYEGQRSFAANASHELRTPLAVQRTLIEVGMTGPLSPPQLELLTRQLLETNERNEALIEGLLALSESDRGLASRTPQRLDVIARDVLIQHQELANKVDVSLHDDLSACLVLGEQVLLERLLTNLVQNAIKYNVSGGRVDVSVAANGRVMVTNTGEPVPAESVAGLFEPFRRLTSTRLHHSGGAGLGLTIARSISRAHDATIEASPGPNGGLRVTVACQPV